MRESVRLLTHGREFVRCPFGPCASPVTFLNRPLSRGEQDPAIGRIASDHT
jgi:hypothetical protein